MECYRLCPSSINGVLIKGLDWGIDSHSITDAWSTHDLCSLANPVSSMVPFLIQGLSFRKYVPLCPPLGKKLVHNLPAFLQSFCYNFPLCSSRKYPYLPHRRDFFLTPSHPSGNSGKASYISLYFWIFQNPHPPGNSNPFCGGSMDIFWNCTLTIYQKKQNCEVNCQWYQSNILLLLYFFSGF